MEWYTGRITKNRKTIYREASQDLPALKESLCDMLCDIMDDELRLWNHSVFYGPESDLDYLEELFADVKGISPKDFFEVNRFCEDYGIHVTIKEGNWL